MAITNDQIRTTLDRYIERYPGEVEHVAPLAAALASGAEVSWRGHFDGGHVTCGAVVTNDAGKLLLIEHKALGRWLLPGGHLEPTDTLLSSAALRELAEETGIPWHDIPDHNNPEAVPIDIDVHGIPASKRRREPAHWHADFRWAFKVADPHITLQAEEVTGHAWRPLSDAPTPKLATKLTGR